ncbi:M48 family metalloprotease [Labrenzia sp. ac12]|uniref:M48 family metalloprotease n=1 Tax=Labrenzia sp. THAF35 TaxID=2587854 RepID=UPI001268D85F|nr:M48 family metalloprotease [Labrenzia sp. THAF35]QFT68625.1 Protease HtpX [Labrenzia sp. THAF35]
MTPTPIKVSRHPVWPTVLIMIAGAELGAVWALVLTFLASITALTVGGPVAMLILGPLVIAFYGVGTVFVLVGTPIWAFVGGLLFTELTIGQTGTPASRLGMMFMTKDHPLAQTVQDMAQKLGLPPIAYVGWYASDDINAFAMGTNPNNAMIAVSKGAIEKLSREQMDAVLAHELGHIASKDMARMTYACGIRDALTFFLIFRGLKKIARWVFTPFSELELLRFSRNREFTADAIAARLTSAEAMIAVLQKLKASEIAPQTHHQAIVMMSAPSVGTWLSTHPTLDARIAKLEASLIATSTEEQPQQLPEPSPQPISS